MLKHVCAAGVGLLAAVAAAYADEPDAFRGQIYAKQLCAGCHAIVADEQASPLAAAPPFVKVAKIDAHTPESFADWLGTAHPIINGVAVKPAVAGDILVYIRGLIAERKNASAPPQGGHAAAAR
jgi:mono/diheme cytochrome c family protein